MNEQRRAYFAGILDTQGWIGFRKKGGRDYYPLIRLVCVHRDMLEMVAHHLGGRVYFHSTGSTTKAKSPVYRWEVAGRNAKVVAAQVRPWLIRRAEIGERGMKWSP